MSVFRMHLDGNKKA
ncbi:hypothetical protein [Escherichia coli]|nr:hypothetical protein [Escherichia coli]MCG9437118.1 hypothetical protein [Escherichia coli]